MSFVINKLLDLEYEGHEWVARELILRLKVDNTETIIDLGCGTGLVGSQLVGHLPARSKLMGVDLSPRMVDIARVRAVQGKRIYMDVTQADAETFLKRVDKGSVGAVVAADVFIYIGDLEGVFAATWDALSSSGLLIFSVELTKSGMALLESGRFGHSKRYIKDLAKRTGFDFVEWREGTLRKQHGAPVQGAVVVLQKLAKEENSK